MNRPILALLGSFAVLPLAMAQAPVGFNIAIQGPTQVEVPSTTYSAASTQGGVWNRMTTPELLFASWSSGPLTDVAGNQTAVRIDVDGRGFTRSDDYDYIFGDHKKLLEHGLDLGQPSSGSTTFTVHGLTPGHYTLFSYTVGILTITGVNVQGDNQSDITFTGFNNGYVEGYSFLVNQFTAQANQPVIINAGPTSPYWSQIDGFQIIPASIPPTTSYCDSTVNSAGAMARMSIHGRSSAHANDLQLGVRDLPLNQFGYFIVSQSQGTGIVPPGSQGNLCIGGSIGRHNRQGEVLFSGTSGAILLDIDLENVPQPHGPAAIFPGETWCWQYWFRDNNPASTSNFSDANAITFTD